MSVQPYLPRVIIFLMPMYILDVHYKDLVVILQCVWWNKDQILDLILCDFSYSVTPPSVSRGDKGSNICYLWKVNNYVGELANKIVRESWLSVIPALKLMETLQDFIYNVKSLYSIKG